MHFRAIFLWQLLKKLKRQATRIHHFHQLNEKNLISASVYEWRIVVYDNTVFESRAKSSSYYKGILLDHDANIVMTSIHYVVIFWRCSSRLLELEAFLFLHLLVTAVYTLSWQRKFTWNNPPEIIKRLIGK